MSFRRKLSCLFCRWVMTVNKMAEYLYLHVPFCRHICYYCDFTHIAYTKNKADEWLEAVEKELSVKRINPCLKTIYIGGGTPTSLSKDQLEHLFRILEPYSANVQEYTIEINPETFDADKAECLQAYGVNRASIGFQTSDPGMLKAIGRNHSYEDAKKTVALLKECGIQNISLDLMYSLPGQTMEMLQKSVEDALALSPTHMSLYSLLVEENTVFGRRGIEPLDEETEADMYEWICEKLEREGFHQYEISNFSLEGKESLHNQAYWKYDDFYGIGCGASGKENHIRYDNTKSLSLYLKDPLLKEEIPLSIKDEMFEMAMMGLRLKQGMDLNGFTERFGIDFEEAFSGKIERLLEKGWLKKEKGHISCSKESFGILNTILIELMD